MAKGIETEGENGNLIPDEDFEYEKKLADEERKKREEAEQKELDREAEIKRRKREAERERERKIAQDRLDLMKMKQGIADESETIKEVHEEQRELHGMEKLKNIWYHDKMWILMGLFVFFVVAFIVYDTVTRVQPDLELLLICDNAVQADSCCVKLGERIERYTPDLNGDGKIKVSVVSCPMNEEKYDQYYTINSQKFFANLQQGRIMMIVTDSKIDKDIEEIFTDALPEQIPGNRYVDEKGFNLNFGFLATEIGCPGMPNDVYIRMREPIDTLSDSIELMQKNYDTCLGVLKAMADDMQAEADACGDKGLPGREEAAKIAESAAAESAAAMLGAESVPQ